MSATQTRALAVEPFIRWTAAIVFVLFGAAKFFDHEAELAAFRDYGLPAPEVFVLAVGVLEVAGGALLVLDRVVRLAALALAANMAGAIVVSGIAEGELLSLTLAPALLLATLFVLWARVKATRPPA